MEFKVTYHTDVGIRKKVNQDALLIKTARDSKGTIALFVVCDGMGGLSSGELASATVINYLSKWFDADLPILLKDTELQGIVSNLEEYLKDINEKIIEYGESNKVKLGTTLTLLLVIYDDYYIIQVGDSRAYKIDNNLELLTKDQTLVARELERGNITAEEAKIHPKRNVLLQCVGATKVIQPHITTGKIEKEKTYMLCTDGFYHEVSEDEIKDSFGYSCSNDESYMNRNIVKLVETVKSRGEVDNITVLLIKTKNRKQAIS